jgi:D-alanyl-D-alanine dipeptidase
MFDIKTGKEVQMPSAYDEMSPRAYPDYTGGPPVARARRDLLRAAMEREGFTIEPNEWWHFNYKDWKEYPILDIPFSEIHSSAPAK